MTAHVAVTTRRSVRVTHSGRLGVTVGHLRTLLAECDEIGIPDDAQVRIESRSSEGSHWSGYIAAAIEGPAILNDLVERDRRAAELDPDGSTP